MKLSDAQMKQAVAEARVLIKARSTGFVNYNDMVTDDEIVQGIAQVLEAVTEDVK
jgi:hypothetical protein